jgi:hypothetical protein
MNLSTITKVTTAKLADSAVSLAKLDYDVIEKFDDKQNVVTGAITTCTTTNLTAGAVVITNAAGKLAVSTGVQAAELEFLGGANHNIQAQLDRIGFMPITDVLVIAGGGAGGGQLYAGGGGAGGFLQESVQFIANQKYAVFIGAGGSSSNTKDGDEFATGFKGEPSGIYGPGVRVVAEGGGGGGSGAAANGQSRGKDGGSGGGASGYAKYDGAGGDETFGQGKRGGRGGFYAAGGGGGASEVGFNGVANTDGGAGGDGAVWSKAKTAGVATFSGSGDSIATNKITFAGGGGGGSGQSPTSTSKVSAGGKGGGGTGGNESLLAPTPGLANTGSGGGGMSVESPDTKNASTAGGSGLVCINYPKGFIASAIDKGVVQKDKNGKNAAVLFKVSGSLFWLAEPPTVTTASVGGTVGVTLTYQVIDSGEVDKFASSLTVVGVAFSTDTGTFIGIPTKAGTFATTVTANLLDGSTNVGTGKGIITFTIAKGTQVITQNDSSVPMQVGDPAYSLGAATTSGLPLTYTSNNLTVATVSAAGLVTILAAGTAIITISQVGNTDWKAAANLTHTVTVTNT